MTKKFLLLAALILAAPAWSADERAKTDRSTRTHTLLVVDDTTGEIRQLKSTASGLKVDASAGGAGTADQGISGISDADPWNMMIRDSSGNELGLAASPFAIRIFDGAAAALFTISNKGFVDTELETADLDTGGGTDTQAVVGLLIAEIGGSKLVGSADPLPVGGTVLDDIELNTDTAQTSSEPIVISIGATPTLIFSASTTRRLGFVQNAGTESVFLGKGAVTKLTGEILAGSSVANNGLGAQAKIEHGDTVFGVVDICCVNVRVSQVSD